MFTALYPHNKNGGVDLKAIAAEAGACKHFCPSKWAKVGGMLQVRLTLCSLPAIHNLRVRRGAVAMGRRRPARRHAPAQCGCGVAWCGARHGARRRGPLRG